LRTATVQPPEARGFDEEILDECKPAPRATVPTRFPSGMTL